MEFRMKKICSKCKEVKDYDEFFNSKIVKSGKRSRCKECEDKDVRKYRENNPEKAKMWKLTYRGNIDNKNKENATKKIYREKNKEEIKIYQKEYRENNKEKAKNDFKKYYKDNPKYFNEKSKKYQKNNPDKIKEYRKKSYAENPEKFKDRNKKWRVNNPEKVNELSNNYQKERRKSDPEFKLSCYIRAGFYNSLKKQLIQKTNKFFSYTGILIEDYIEHFKNSELWDEYYNGKNIHVDHIIPCYAYNFKNKEHIKMCWDPLNLRLLPAKENYSKNNKIDFDLIKLHDIEHLLPNHLKGERN